MTAIHPAMADAERAMNMFDALDLGVCSDVMHMVVIPGAPWSKSRPRFARGGHAYTRTEDVDAETRTAGFLRRSIREPMTGNVALGCVFYRPNRQRIDADNMLKHVCDAANGVVWLDDSQCTAVMATVEMDAANPRTIVVIGEHASTMARGTDATYPCVVCGKPIGMVGQDTRRLTCSRACTAHRRGHPHLSEPVACAWCGQPFVRTTSYQHLCSPQCRTASLRDRRRALARPRSECMTCGAELAHTRGGRCRDCWRADPSGRLTAEREGRLW